MSTPTITQMATCTCAMQDGPCPRHVYAAATQATTSQES